MQRRSVLAAAVAALFPPVPPAVHACLPDGFVRLCGDGVHDDTVALQALVDQCARTGQPLRLRPGAVYRISSPIKLST